MVGWEGKTSVCVNSSTHTFRTYARTHGHFRAGADSGETPLVACSVTDCRVSGLSRSCQTMCLSWLQVVCRTFATGFQAIPIFTWLFFPLILAYSRQSWLHVVVASIVATLTTTISILGLLDGIYDQPGIQHPWIVLGMLNHNIYVRLAYWINRLDTVRICCSW